MYVDEFRGMPECHGDFITFELSSLPCDNCVYVRNVYFVRTLLFKIASRFR